MNMIQSRPEEKSKNYVNLTPKIGNQNLVPLPTCSPQCLYLGEFHLWYGTQYQVIFWMCWGWNLKAVDLLIYFYAYNLLQSPTTNELNILSSDSNTTVRNYFV